MPEFDTTGPIAATVTLAAGDVRVTAGDTPGTTVEIRPADPGSERDRTWAEQTVVEYANGRLLVKGPKQRNFGIFAKTGVIDVEITLAAGSGLDADGAVLNLTGTGPLGEVRAKSGVGDIRLDRVAALEARSGAGNISVQAVDGDATATTGAGDLRVGDAGGKVELKTGTGQARVDRAGGHARIRSSNGEVQIGRAGGNVDATTANGPIRVGEVSAGTAVTLKTAMGELEVGVPEGLPAYLDVHTSFGTVHSRLEASEAPSRNWQHVEVHARTSYGDIIIRRP